MAEINELWARLEAWSSEHAPKMLEDLNPGASDEQIAGLSKALARELPESFLHSLRVHDGENDGWPSKVMADMGACLPSGRIVEHWQMHRQIAEQMADQLGGERSDEEVAELIRDNIITVDGSVRPETFHPAWVPIMDSNGNVFWALDFAPAEGGIEGQVIQVDLEGCEWKVVANSFAEFFASYVESLEAGEFEVANGLATKFPEEQAEDANSDSNFDTKVEAFDAATGIEELGQLAPGTQVDIVGIRTGTVEGDRCDLEIRGGTVRLRGSLRGTTFNQVLRVAIITGKRRGFGLLRPSHEIVSWDIV